jgi:hypothetical protein
MNVKIHMVRTKRSDVLCIACGGFQADHVVLVAGADTDYGCHRKCLPRLHVKRTRKVVEHAAAE